MKQYDHLRIKLEEERDRLEGQLKQMALQDPHHKGEWEPKIPDLNPMPADINEMSDVFEEMDNRAGIEYQLEERLKDVLSALKRIENGTYGKCEVGGENIEEKRLEANPAAKTCMKHAKE